jgi:hypothetical protein
VLASAPASAAPMQVSGDRLLDSCGEPFVVRGVEQILGRELPPGNDWLGLVDQISKTGANAVRILPGVNTLTVSDVDRVLTLIAERGMVAFLAPLSQTGNWFAREDVKTMLLEHESYIIIDAYGEPQYDDLDRWRSEAADALREFRDLGYHVPLTVTANQFGRDLPSILDYGDEILSADPEGNTFLGWQAYWGQGGYYMQHYGMTLNEAVQAIVDSGLPIQMGLDHVTDLPSETADYGLLMTLAERNDIGWLWWDWFNPYGAENNLSQNGSSGSLTATGRVVVNTHAASIANTSRMACSGPVDGGPVFINAGGTGEGQFEDDGFFSGGNVAPRSTASIDRSRVTNPAPQSVYQTERWGAMRYTVDGFAPRSAHSVTLHFAEVVFNAARKRRFNVDINGSRVLTNFDIFSAAGAKNRAVTRQFNATADASGVITINFGVGAYDQPKVSGIAIE